MARVGGKKIFLPNFTIALIRTPHLPPTSAEFIVPLNINKLDLKDYLRNAYGVEVNSVRSFVQQKKIQPTKDPESRTRRWYRPRAIKKMIVELKEPFIYPEEPKDLSPWDNELYKALEKQRDENSDIVGPRATNSKYKKSIRELASQKLATESQSEPEMVEVEKELKVE